jgi:hypothetical protein
VKPDFYDKTTRYSVYEIAENLPKTTKYCGLYPKTLDFLTHNDTYKTLYLVNLNKYRIVLDKFRALAERMHNKISIEKGEMGSRLCRYT